MKYFFLILMLPQHILLAHSDSLEKQASYIKKYYDIKSINYFEPRYVQFSDVKSWTFAPPHHAVGYDDNHEIIAIFDLTYQNTRSLEFIERSLLGTIGFGDINLREIIKVIRDVVERYKNNIPPPSAIYWDIEIPDDYLDFPAVEKFLNDVEEQYGDYVSPLKDNWWSNIPLKPSAKFGDKNQLERFSLADIDYDSLLSEEQKSEFNKNLADLADTLQQLFDIDASNILKEISVRINASGIYELILSVHDKIDNANAQPMKVLDLVRFQNTRRDAIIRLLAKELVSNIASLIPNPEAASLIQYAIVRFIHLYEEQQTFHRFRAFEYIAAAERGDPSPFSALTPVERKKAGVYVLSHEASIFYQILKPRTEVDYYNSLAQENQLSIDNQHWADDNNIILALMSQNFAHATKVSELDNILVLGDQLRFEKRPFMAIDYEFPEAIRIERTLLNSIGDALSAIKLPIPGITAALTALYYIFVMDNVNKAMTWEARLASYFHFTSDTSYAHELELLYGQRVNPFEFELYEQALFIPRSKALLGL